MNWSQLKNKIKSSLYDYKSEEDALEMWNTLSPEVNALNRINRKRDNRYFFLFFMVGGILVLSYVAFQNWNSFKQDNSLRGPIAKNKNVRLTEPAETITEPKENEQAKINREKVIQNSNSKEDESIVSPQEIDYPNDDNTIMKSKDEVGFNTPQENNPLKEDNLFTTVESNFSSEIGGEQKYSLYSNSDLDIEAIQSRVFTKTSSIDLLSLPNLSLTSWSILPPVSNINFETNKSPSKIRFNMGVKTGLYYASKKLNAKETVDVDFLQSRLATESMLETLHAGIYGQLTFHSNFNISLGFDFSRINEAFRFTEVSEEFSVIQGVRYVVTGNGMNPLGINNIGEVAQLDRTTTDYTVFNHYDLIDIPILLGYSWSKNKWTYGLQTGVIANLSFKGKGRILDSELKSVNLSETSIFKQSLSLSYAVNVIFERKISELLSITFAPNFRYFPNEFTNDDYRLELRYQLVGADLGFKYLFN